MKDAPNSLSGHTHPYAVLGHPIGHSLSPIMHNASFDSLGLDAIYLAFDVHPDRLMNTLEAMRDMGFRGVNLTVPLKEVAFRGLAACDDTASLFGAVNTVAFREEGLVGYNTDGYGFLTAAQEAFGPSVHGESVFVLGTGGAGRALALTCASKGAKQIVLTDVDLDRSRRVAEEIVRHYPEMAVQVVDVKDQTEAAHASQLIIQSTPVGMKPTDPSLLGPEAFHSGQKVYDLVYMYPETALLRTARTAGAQIANGLGMLLHQGARAFQIWTNTEADVVAMRKALEKAVYGT